MVGLQDVRLQFKVKWVRSMVVREQTGCIFCTTTSLGATSWSPLASSPGHSHVNNVARLHVTLKSWVGPGDEARSPTGSQINIR